MKKLAILSVIVCSLLLPLTVSASTLPEPTKTLETETDNNFRVITNYTTLKVGYSIALMGDYIRVVSGSSYITTRGMFITGRSPGRAVVYAYKNGSLYSKQYITVIY